MNKYSFLLIFAFIANIITAQDNLPYAFINNSTYEDSEIYIALIGKFGDNVDVWMDMDDYSLVPMSADQNVLEGPEWSTPASWLYPDIFTKLSDLTDKTLQIPQGIYGSRIFISFESPMYLHFHETGGYAGANLNASTDPNDGIRWEVVELTWGNSGLWTNTSRVDAYQYPIALEVNGFTGPLVGSTYAESFENAISGNGTPKYGKVGENLPHEEILTRWDDEVSTEYLVAKVIKDHSIDGGHIIEQPSKVEEFPEDIFEDYINDIWTTFADYDLVIDIGERGIWTGSVTGNQFDFVDPVDGSIASIYGIPSSFNAIEGSGFLAYTEVLASENQEKHDEDLMIQAQVAAAINRHAIDTDVIDGTVQLTHDASTFFIQEPYNEYVSFFHNEEISYESQTYAFAYDDVGDHSSTLQNTFPTSVRVIIGGYDQYVDPAPELAFLSIAPYVQEIEIGSDLQYIAQAYDQYSAPFVTAVEWSTTGGGTINSDGLFSASALGEFIITAVAGDLSKSVTIQVVDAPEELSGCEGLAPNGDYSYVATDDPTITFVPTEAGTGDNLCLFYYKTDSTAPNFMVSGVTPNEAFTVNAVEGDTVFFYYTYSLNSGGENNTSNTLQNFIVGECSPPAERALYVDNFAEILNSAAEKTMLLEYAQNNGIDYLMLYELHLVHNEHDMTNAVSNQILADFMVDAKQNYGIKKIAGTAENAWFFENRIMAYNETRTVADEKFDALGMEFEFWTPLFTDPGGYYCVNYLTPNGYSCDNAGAYAFCKNELQAMRTLVDNSTHPMTTEMYVGWPDATQLLEIADLVDETLIHAYVPDPNNAFSYAEGRLQYYENYAGIADIKIIFSAEPNFSGPWLLSNGLPAAETVFMDDYNAAEGDWKNHVQLKEFAYFTYTMMNNDIVLPIQETQEEEDEAELPSIQLFPNPTTDRIYLKADRILQPFELKNQQGQILQSGDFLPDFIDLSNYSAGLYYLHLQGETFKVIKIGRD